MKKIFVVEDDQGIMEVIEMVLSSENYDVQSFSTIKEFIKRDTNINPDLYLFDVMLPDGSGIDLCKEIKKNVLGKNSPVIMMSAHAQLKQIADQCQPDDFIPKPFDIDDLVKKVQEVIENK